LLDSWFQRFQGSYDSRQVPRSGIFWIRKANLNRIVAKINDFVANFLQPLDETGGTQGRRASFVPWHQGGGACGCAQHSDFSWLADYFDRHSCSPVNPQARSESGQLATRF
jgi:hypothetical protein